MYMYCMYTFRVFSIWWKLLHKNMAWVQTFQFRERTVCLSLVNCILSASDSERVYTCTWNSMKERLMLFLWFLWMNVTFALHFSTHVNCIHTYMLSYWKSLSNRCVCVHEWVSCVYLSYAYMSMHISNWPCPHFIPPDSHVQGGVE